MSRTSGSWVQPSPGGSSSGPTQRSSPSGPYQTGIRCPHHSWREMVQSCMLSTQSKYLAAISGGWIGVRPSRTASPAALASGATLTNHCVRQPRLDDVVGARAVPDGVHVRDLLGDDPALRAQLLLDRGPRLEPVHAVETGSGAGDPGRLVEDGRRRQPVPTADLEVVGVVRGGHLDRAGAELRVDVVVGDHRDLAGSRSAAARSARPGGGSARRRGAPRWRCRRAWSRPGWSRRRPTRVVHRRRSGSDTSSPASSECSTSMSDSAVRQPGHQLMIRSAR